MPSLTEPAVVTYDVATAGALSAGSYNLLLSNTTYWQPSLNAATTSTTTMPRYYVLQQYSEASDCVEWTIEDDYGQTLQRYVTPPGVHTVQFAVPEHYGYATFTAAYNGEHRQHRPPPLPPPRPQPNETFEYWLGRVRDWAHRSDQELEDEVVLRAQWDRDVEARRREAEHRREQRRIAAEREEARARRLHDATQRAEDLLMSLLSPTQQAEYRAHQTITLRGSAGNWFRLDTTCYDGNVSWVDLHGGDQRGRMCAHTQAHVEGGTLPRLDVIAGQVLALRFNEPEFIGHANHYSGQMPQYGQVQGVQPLIDRIQAHARRVWLDDLEEADEEEAEGVA